MNEKTYSQRRYRRMREKEVFGMFLSRKDHAELEALSHKSGFTFSEYVPRRRRRQSLRTYFSASARAAREAASIPAEALVPRVPASQLFQPTVDPTWLARSRAKILKLTFGAWFPLAFGGTVAWNTLSGVGSAHGLPLLVLGQDFAIMVPTALALFGLVLRRQMQQSRGAYAHNTTQFKIWFKERYGVELSKGSLGKLQSSIEGKYAFPASTSLKDEAGGKYLLTNNGGLALSRVESSGAKVLIGGPHPEKPNALERVEVALFGEAQVMHDNLSSLLERAESCDLSVEQEHIVHRVREDLSGGIELYSQLAKLERTEDGAILFCNLLGEWIEEITSVLNAQAEGVLDQLRVAQTYARERKMLSSSSPRLQLPAASDQPVDYEEVN